MRVLILNWRSIKDPLAGGAETATFEHAKRWVQKHNVTVYWLSPKYKADLKSEIIDGIHFKYIGLPLNRNTFHLLYRYPIFYFLVFVTYIKSYRSRVDVVIDQVHGLPYLTPLYVKEPIIVHVNEIAGDIWDKMYKFPINKLGKLLEKIIFKPYKWKKITFVAISNSTKFDIVKLGISDSNTKIVYCGVSTQIVDKPGQKEQKFTIIFLNRLVKMKGIERAIDVVLNVKKNIPDVVFWVVGSGEATYVETLKKQINDLGLSDQTKFWGFVDDDTKTDLLTRAHVLINASYKEGWGLVNIEANSKGTPVVAFDVPGNKESVNNGKSGYTAPDGDVQSMVDMILQVKNTPKLNDTAIEFAKKFDWDNVAEDYYNVLTSLHSTKS